MSIDKVRIYEDQIDWFRSNGYAVVCEYYATPMVGDKKKRRSGPRSRRVNGAHVLLALSKGHGKIKLKGNCLPLVARLAKEILTIHPTMQRNQLTDLIIKGWTSDMGSTSSATSYISEMISAGYFDKVEV